MRNSRHQARGDAPATTIADHSRRISALFQHITPAIPAGASMDEAVEANVRHQVGTLSRASTVISGALATGEVAVHGAVYGLSDGRVRFLTGA